MFEFILRNELKDYGKQADVFLMGVLFLQLKYGSVKVGLKVFEHLRNTKYKKNAL